MVRPIDGRKPSADPFDQDGDTEVTDNGAFGGSHGSDDIGSHAVIGQSRVNLGDVDLGGSGGAFPPQSGRGNPGLSLIRRDGRQRSDQPPIRSGDEPSIDPRVGRKCLGEPLLRGQFRIGAREHLYDFRLGLVVLDNAACSAQIVSHQMRNQLHEGLPVMQDL